MNKTTLCIIGLGIMFGRLDIHIPPQAPAASAGEVLFREGEPVAALRGGGVEPEPPEEPVPVAVDLREMQKTAEAIAKQAELPKTITVNGKQVELAPLLEETHKHVPWLIKTGDERKDISDYILRQWSIPTSELAVLSVEELRRLHNGLCSTMRLEFGTWKVRSDLDEPELAPEWVASVYEVRVTGTSTDPKTWGMKATSRGSAVAVGPAKLHTAKHLTHQINAFVVEVQVNGEWRRGSWTAIPGKDLAVIELTGTAALPAVKVRAPVYGERLSVYGLTTKSYAEGDYAGDHNPAFGDGLLPLGVGQTVVEQGDSGGGVFGDDGFLVGTLTGRAEHCHNVATMVPIVTDAPKAASSAPLVQVPSQSSPAVQSCPGGICPRPSVVQPSTRRGRRH